MKTFKQLVSEVAEPRGGDEKRFKAKHVVAKTKHPVADDDQFVAKQKKDKSKPAGYHDGEDAEVYESAGADIHTKRADKKAVIVHDVDSRTGQSKTIVKKQRAGEIKVEQVEYMEEDMFTGLHKLKDGSSVRVDKKQNEMLTALFKELKGSNRDKMKEKMMSGKKGFGEILAFAKNAV